MTTFYLIATAALLPCLFCLENFRDPLCTNVVCPPNHVCRHYKPCEKNEDCDVMVICTNQIVYEFYVCKHGEPVIVIENYGLEPMPCSPGSCPGSLYYCHTTGFWKFPTVCCLKDEGPSVVSGSCPPVKLIPEGGHNPRVCRDECTHDVDCAWDDMCCNTGCKKECVRPSTIDGPVLPPIPPPKGPDPCDTKVCPPWQRCLRRGRHCVGYRYCGPVGQCSYWLPHNDPTSRPEIDCKRPGERIIGPPGFRDCRRPRERIIGPPGAPSYRRQIIGPQRG